MLKRFARLVVRNRRGVLGIAALLLVFGVWGLLNASINYDMLSYVPDDLDSVKGFNLLTEEFRLGNSAQVLVTGMPDREVADIVERIEAVEGVDQVGWVDDFGEFTVVREFWETDLADSFYSDDSTFFQVNFTGSANDPSTRAAVEQMRDILGDAEYHIAGIQQLELEDVINRERGVLAGAALLLVAIALLLTVPSVIVPLLFVVTIGLAVVYNLGLSYYIGQEVSYLTGVIVLALQFAVTMDYALFLYHRYEQERAKAPDNESAMATAITSTFKSISAAAFTTIAGFLALIVMRLGFGEDMGVTLARGVFITVIAVLTILPVLLLTFDAPIRRFAHKVRLPDFHRLGGWLARHAKPMTLVFALMFVPSLWLYNQVELSYNLDSALPEDLPSMTASDRLSEEFGRAQSFFIVAEDTGRIAQLDALADSVGQIEGVTEVTSYVSMVSPLIPAEFIPEKARENFFKTGYTYLNADVSFGFTDPRTDQVMADLCDVAQEYPGTAYVTGQSVLFNDLEETSKGDVGRVNTLSVVAIAIIVALVFRSLAVPAILLAAIELAIYFNQGLAVFSSGEVIFIATLAIGAIQLGATVDYAILLTGRYEEELTRSGDRESAMREALGGAGPSILVSASTMFAATIGLVFLSSVSTISDLTLLIARGAVVSFFVVIMLMPSVLVMAQPVLERLSIGWPRLSKERD